MIKPIQINDRVIELIKKQLEASMMKIAYKKGFIQFYVPTLFGSDKKDYDALITLSPKQDKGHYKIGAIKSEPYRVILGIVKRIDHLDPESAVDDIQTLLHEVRSALNSNFDDDEPFKGVLNNYTVSEAFPAEFSQPDGGIPVIACMMTIDFTYDQVSN